MTKKCPTDHPAPTQRHPQRHPRPGAQFQFHGMCDDGHLRPSDGSHQQALSSFAAAERAAARDVATAAPIAALRPNCGGSLNGRMATATFLSHPPVPSARQPKANDVRCVASGQPPAQEQHNAPRPRRSRNNRHSTTCDDLPHPLTSPTPPPPVHPAINNNKETETDAIQSSTTPPSLAVI